VKKCAAEASASAVLLRESVFFEKMQNFSKNMKKTIDTA
jgi:hypothetical protein